MVSGALNLVLGLGLRTWTLKSKAVPCALTLCPNPLALAHGPRTCGLRLAACGLGLGGFRSFVSGLCGFKSCHRSWWIRGTLTFGSLTLGTLTLGSVP